MKPQAVNVTRQQCWVIEFAGDRQGALGPIHAAADKHVQHSRVGECAGTNRGGHLDVVRIVFGENGIEPCPAFQNASACHP